MIFRNAGGVIDGRKYTEHALERMAPDTIQVRAELTKRARERAERNGYTFGSKEYMEELKVDPRGVTPSVVEETIKHATKNPEINLVYGNTMGKMLESY